MSRWTCSTKGTKRFQTSGSKSTAQTGTRKVDASRHTRQFVVRRNGDTDKQQATKLTAQGPLFTLRSQDRQSLRRSKYPVCSLPNPFVSLSRRTSHVTCSQSESGQSLCRFRLSRSQFEAPSGRTKKHTSGVRTGVGRKKELDASTVYGSKECLRQVLANSHNIQKPRDDVIPY